MLLEEKETLIIWNAAEDIVRIDSHEPSVWRKAERIGAKLVEERKYKGRVISKCYEFPKKKFTWGRKRRVSKAQRERFRERMQSRFK